MFTGVDIIVVILVLTILFYANGSEGGGGSGIKMEPLTFLVVVIVLGMIIMSFS